jgi:hypothetical protein
VDLEAALASLLEELERRKGFVVTILDQEGKVIERVRHQKVTPWSSALYVVDSSHEGPPRRENGKTFCYAVADEHGRPHEWTFEDRSGTSRSTGEGPPDVIILHVVDPVPWQPTGRAARLARPSGPAGPGLALRTLPQDSPSPGGPA